MSGHNTVGIDLGINKVSLAAWWGDGLIDARTVESAEPERDMVLHELAALCQNMCSAIWQADSIWVEEPLVGNNIKYSLAIAETFGAVLAALSPMRYTGADVRSVNVQSWKKQVLGKGNASKDQVRNYILATHPDYAPLCGDDQDLYDACCIGLYGRRLLARSTTLHLAGEDPE